MFGNILHGILSKIISETLQTPIKMFLQLSEEKLCLATFHISKKKKKSVIYIQAQQNFSFRLEKYNNNNTWTVYE